LARHITTPNNGNDIEQIDYPEVLQRRILSLNYVCIFQQRGKECNSRDFYALVVLGKFQHCLSTEMLESGRINATNDSLIVLELMHLLYQELAVL